MIRGKSVKLRALERDDLPQFWKWENDEEIMEFASCAPDRVIPKDAIAKIYESSLSADPFSTHYYVIVAADDAPIGLISYWTPNRRFRESAEIGFYIGERDYWRGGYATDAVLAICYTLFKHLHFHRVSVCFGSYNFRLYEWIKKHGITMEGIIREERFMRGRYYDTVRAGILESEFDALHESWVNSRSAERDHEEQQSDI